MTESNPRDPRVHELIAKYEQLMHAVMTGVGYTQTFNPDERDVKHIKTGINSALISQGATAKLLLDKGIFTELEYWSTLIEFTEREVESYQRMLEHHYRDSGTKPKITLH